MSISFSPARVAGAAGVCLALFASPAAAQSCIGSLGGQACNLSTSLAMSTVSVGGATGSMSQVFVNVLGADAYNSLQLFYTVGGVPMAISAPKPKGAMGWSPSGDGRVQLDGLFAAGSELQLSVLVNGSQMLHSGTAGSSNPGGSVYYREFAAGETIYRDNRTTEMASGSGSSTKKVYGFDDSPLGGDRDYNDLVFEVESVTVTPEPGTLLLVGGGLLGLGGVTMRRRRQLAVQA